MKPIRLACALALVVVTASGQAPDPVARAQDVYFDRGVLGASVVLLLIALVVVFRLLLAAHQRYVDIVIKLTDVLARNTEALTRNDVAHADLVSRLIDRGSGSFPRARSGDSP